MPNKLISEIKEKANKILNDNKISMYANEKEIVEKLNKILYENIENEDYELLNKTLDNIDTYMKTKEKMELTKQDYNYLGSLAKALKEQTIRKTDGILYIPLFKIKNIDGEETYFLTRESAKKYIEMNNNWVMSDIIEIEESDNTDLAKVIEIIKRNF